MAQVKNIQEFVEFAGLYQRFVAPTSNWPGSISRYCEEDGCKRETTWRVSQTAYEQGFSLVRYECQLCKSNRVHFMVLTVAVTADDKRTIQYVWLKVGQYPAPSIDLPNELERQLGKDDAELYRRSLICRNQGYGLGALIYMRRVVENKTNEMIDTLAEFSRQSGADPEDVKKLLESKNERRFEDRINVASMALPKALRPGGHNPLKALFDLLSDGVHSKTEEECLAIADDLCDIFEWVFSKLRAEVDDLKAVKAKLDRIGQRAPAAAKAAE